MESILTSIKKLSGIAEEYTHFDDDLIIYINSVFIILRQLGVGPSSGFSITDDTETWDDFSSNSATVHMVKSYMSLKVRIQFDPPTGGVLDAMKELISEYEWRMNVDIENNWD